MGVTYFISCWKLNLVFLMPFLTPESHLGGISVNRLGGHMPLNTMHMSEKTLGSLSLMYNKVYTTGCPIACTKCMHSQHRGLLTSFFCWQMVSRSMTEMLAANWLLLG